MSEIKYGGPAFPVPGLMEDPSFNGMSLRDYFAAKAMAAHISRFQAGENSVDFPADEIIAQWAYEHADTMLRARGEA